MSKPRGEVLRAPGMKQVNQVTPGVRSTSPRGFLGTAMKKHIKHRPHPATPAVAPAGSGFGRKALIAIPLLLLAAGGTWAFFEYVVWNRLPPELVGKWAVVEGPKEYKEAVFEFHRSGRMIGYVNYKEMVRIIKAEVRVEDGKI